ncbi:MAG: sporulation protein YqfC [Bacillota bacterium]|nr:sporulation protein YqfC [Bacillota bacterium]
MPERPSGLAGALEAWLELPDDTLLDLPRLTLIGQVMLLLENHRGLVRYTPEEIRVATRIGLLLVGGEELVVRKMDREQLVLAGRIASIRLERPVRPEGQARPERPGERRKRPWG